MLHEDDDCLSEHVCPECREGKHRNCRGDAWCVKADEPTECVCFLAGHGEGDGGDQARILILVPGHCSSRPHRQIAAAASLSELAIPAGIPASPRRIQTSNPSVCGKTAPSALPYRVRGIRHPFAARRSSYRGCQKLSLMPVTVAASGDGGQPSNDRQEPDRG